MHFDLVVRQRHDQLIALDKNIITISLEESIVTDMIAQKHPMMKAYKKYCPTYELLYSARRLIESRIIESAAYCNQIMLVPLYLNSTQNMSVN
jgi:hypothetical protein